MNIEIMLEAEVTEFDPAMEGKEFAKILNKRLNDALVSTLKLATEQSGVIPMADGAHLTDKTWEGTAECRLSITRVEEERTELEESYDPPLKEEYVETGVPVPVAGGTGVEDL